MNSPYSLASKYVGWRWSVIPIPHGQKFPTFGWHFYQNRLPSDEELHKWFDGQDVGMAVVCGSASGGLAVLDFDTPGAYAHWAKANKALAAKLPTETRPGTDRMHVYVRLESPVPSGNLYLRGFPGKAGELLSEGHLAVMPPTRHPGGGRRFWTKEPSPDIPILTLEECGVQTLKVEAGHSERTAELLTGNIATGERHKTLTSIAGKLRNAGHTERMIVDMLRCVNDARCTPPLPDSEVIGIGRWAGALPPSNVHPLASSSEDENQADVSVIITPSSIEDEDSERFAHMFKSCPDYLAEQGEDIVWLVEELLPQDYLVVLGGTSKAGKSCLATSLAVAISTGTPFLGLTTTKGSVLWCAYEESEQERAMVLREFDVTPSELYVTHEKLHIDSADGIAALRWWVRKTNARLIVIDPLYGANTADSLSDGRKAREVLAGLKDLCRTEKVCALVLHHFTKNVAAGVTRERFADSNQILATASMDILMDATERSDGTRAIKLQGRGRGAFANRTWCVRSTGVTDFTLEVSGSASDVDAQLRDEHILQVIREAQKPLTADEVAEAAGLKPGTARNRLTALQKRSAVVVAGRQSNANLYELPPEAAQPVAFVA